MREKLERSVKTKICSLPLYPCHLTGAQVERASDGEASRAFWRVSRV